MEHHALKLDAACSTMTRSRIYTHGRHTVCRHHTQLQVLQVLACTVDHTAVTQSS